MTQLRQLALALYQKKFDERLADALGLIDMNRKVKGADAARRAAGVDAYSTCASSSNAPPTVTNTTTTATPQTMPASKAMPKTVHPTPKLDASKSGKGSGTYIRRSRSAQGKVVELIGRSSVERRGGAWNDRLSELCMRAVEEANTTFDADEDMVLTELYERITIDMV